MSPSVIKVWWALFSLRNYNSIAINNIWQIMKSALRSSFLLPSLFIKWHICDFLNFWRKNAKHQSQVLFPIAGGVVGVALYTNIITWLRQLVNQNTLPVTINDIWGLFASAHVADHVIGIFLRLLFFHRPVK